ncbi:GNAT family N-acetyltransferase [Candidatus Colwellia aromaticivorans]|uniref:GNAT family N-acetyltransferase n=1 Tax=Candidatus Colwellia aromaticivorans TaxID=2267621 RepID=UPI000DF2F6BC|nr:GNAT family N-acetyltransferase [Candidatus Colwellia aromaticivorans]
MTQWKIKKFDELSLHQLYDALKLRIDVFVVEQRCYYPDLDSEQNQLDRHKETLHLLGYQGDTLVAYLRILPSGQSYDNYISIGRVATAKQARGTGLGHELMSEGLKVCQQHFAKQNIKVSAQEHLKEFYQQHNFEQVSEMYLEDDIPHVAMVNKR